MGHNRERSKGRFGRRALSSQLRTSNAAGYIATGMVYILFDWHARAAKRGPLKCWLVFTHLYGQTRPHAGRALHSPTMTGYKSIALSFVLLDRCSSGRRREWAGRRHAFTHTRHHFRCRPQVKGLGLAVELAQKIQAVNKASSTLMHIESPSVAF